MNEPIETIADDLAEEAAGDVTSPVSGISEALTAGASLLSTATHWRARRIRRVVKIELPAYLLVQCSWFMAFGLQMVLFPYL
ncbi:MAG TPA: MFS transporter, partial [Hyphomonas sp.]|nr:MFS transporter [Hyphomonas sp.]